MLKALLHKEEFLTGGIALTILLFLGIILLKFSTLATIIIPAVGLLALIFAIFIRNPVYYIYLYFASFTLYLENNPGIHLKGALFFALTIIFIGFYYIPLILRGDVAIETTIDKWYVLFVIFILFGFFNGLIYSHSRFHTFSDMTYFFGIILYLPFKKNFSSKNFQKTIFFILILICGYVLVRNFINYREIILSTNIKWKLQDARVPVNEILILTGTILSLLGYAHAPKKTLKLILFLIYLLFVGGLILTQSRGYWITFVIAVFIILVLGDKSIKRYVFFGNLILVVLGATVTILFFSHIFHIILGALAKRWESISTISSVSHMGVSLLERYYETKKIIHLLSLNPVTGYGMGTTYHRYYIIPAVYIPMTYIHNGYLAIWFKTGIIGLLAIVAFCLTTIKKLYRIHRLSDTRLIKLISLASLSLLIGMLIVNITSPQFLAFDSMSLIMLMGVFASYYSAHWIPLQMKKKAITNNK